MFETESRRQSKTTLMLLLTIFLAAGLLAAETQPPAVNETPEQAAATVKLLADSVVTPGDTFSVSIVISDSTPQLGGFNLLIEYDVGALVFDSATAGELLAGQWEYFEFRTGAVSAQEKNDTRAFIRLVAIADMHNVKGRPDPEATVGPGEIVRLHLYAADRLAAGTGQTALRFLWQGCGDNSFSDNSGDRLYLSRRVLDGAGRIAGEALEPYRGAAADCFDSELNPPLPLFDYQHLDLKTSNAEELRLNRQSDGGSRRF